MSQVLSVIHNIAAPECCNSHKQTMSPTFFSTGLKEAVHPLDKYLSCSGNYVEKYTVCPLSLAVLDMYNTMK
jgi:hypothetical protein